MKGELKFLRPKGPDPLGISSKGCLLGDRCQEKSESQVSHYLPMGTNHDQYLLSFYVNVQAWGAESILN